MKNKILFIKNGNSTFLKKDEILLSQIGEVISFDFKQKKGLAFLIKNFNFIFFFIRNYSGTTSCVIWFANFHSVLPTFFCKLFSIKSLIILGGSDVNSVKSIGYGASKSNLMQQSISMSIRLSDVLFPVSSDMLPKLSQQYGQNILAKAHHVPTGYDHLAWPLEDHPRHQVITVGVINSKERFLVKGIDRFIALAAACPNIPFTIVGVAQNALHLFENRPANLTIKGKMTPSQLKDEYNHSSIYIQLSRSEGLPNVMCEAMLCGCHPVGTNVGDIPALLEDVGTVITNFETTAVAKIIADLNQSASYNPLVYRAHIMDHYNLDRRMESFKSIL